MEHVVTWALVGLAVVLAVGWYLSYLAARLDRLHHRVESSWAALEAQLARRAAATLEVAAVLPPTRRRELVAAASPAIAPAGNVDRLEAVENRLTRQLQASFGEPADIEELRTAAAMNGSFDDLLDDLAGAAHRAQLARRFHNDAVAHAQRMRRKRVVRWARLAGRAAWPVMVELDDSVPAPLAGREP